jgi:hypothetical protein
LFGSAGKEDVEVSSKRLSNICPCAVPIKIGPVEDSTPDVFDEFKGRAGFHATEVMTIPFSLARLFHFKFFGFGRLGAREDK